MKTPPGVFAGLDDKKWYWFSVDVGRHWAIGWTQFGVHLQTILFSVSYSNAFYAEVAGAGGQGWNLAFWPKFPKPRGRGGDLYRFNLDMRV